MSDQTYTYKSEITNGVQDIGSELATAISLVMGELHSIAKDKDNTMQGYSFASETAIANAIRPLMAKQGLSLVPFSIEVMKSDQIQTKNALLNRVMISASYRLSHKSGQSILLTVPGEGMDSLDKAVQKALTAAYKYCVIQCFLAGRGDDGDEGTGYEGGKVTASQPVSPPGRAGDGGASSGLTRPAAASHRQDDGGYVMTFGKFKDQSIRNCDSDYLKWLLKETDAALSDPKKAAFKIKNQKLIEIILDEVTRREKNARPEPAQEEIPF